MTEEKTIKQEDVVSTDDKNKKDEYLYSVGKRKTSVAQIRVFKKGEGNVEVNAKDFKVYFPKSEWQETVLSPLKMIGQDDKLNVTVKVSGGGIFSQAQAIRHGLAKALIQLNPNFRKPLKKAGYITRDPRKKERKKPGLKSARRAPQWKKR
jgi:small subunit ribosomal protein S9